MVWPQAQQARLTDGTRLVLQERHGQSDTSLVLAPPAAALA